MRQSDCVPVSLCHCSPPPPPPVTEGRTSGRGYSVQYQYRPSPTEDSSEEEFSILGDQTETGAQIKVEDSEDSEVEEEEVENTNNHTEPHPEIPGQNIDEGYKNCMKSVFKNIAEAQQSETKTDDISITFHPSPDDGRPVNAREIQYKVEAEAEEEAEPVSPEKMPELMDSAFTMSESELGRPEGFQPSLFLLLGPPSLTDVVVSEVVRSSHSLQCLHINTLVQKNIRSLELLPS